MLSRSLTHKTMFVSGTGGREREKKNLCPHREGKRYHFTSICGNAIGGGGDKLIYVKSSKG